VLGDMKFQERGNTDHVKITKNVGASTNTIDATITGEIVSESGH
jgi:hypothetical protein